MWLKKTFYEPGNAGAPSPVLNVFLDTKPPKIL
jgi:hypothetical protein